MKKNSTGKPVPVEPVAEDVELRKPGFIFLELGTPRLDEYIAFFESVMEFKLIRHEPDYAEMESRLGQLLLMDPAGLPEGHPFHDKPPGGKRGYGVEMGFVVGDLDKAFAAAALFKDRDWVIASRIMMRPWGVRDFRVLSPDGYYLRFTEGPNPVKD